MDQFPRTKSRTQGPPWNSISKLAGFRWYLNRIENLLLSIYAEHPDIDSDPYQKQGEDYLYSEVWKTLGVCDTSLVGLKKKYAPPKPDPREQGRGKEEDCEGCWDDSDCFDDWVCRKGFCRPPNGDQSM